jgi:hypothetical protein
MTWCDTLLRILKGNDIRLTAYVPDNVLTPLIAGAGADNYFLPVSATRLCTLESNRSNYSEVNREFEPLAPQKSQRKNPGLWPGFRFNTG